MSIFKKQPDNYNDLYALVMSNIITPLNLDTADQKRINVELKWLFAAAENLISVSNNVQQSLEKQRTKYRRQFSGDILFTKKVDEAISKITPETCRTIIERSQPVRIPIPPDAQCLPEATNRLLRNPQKLIDAADVLQQWSNQNLKWQFSRIDTHLRSLSILLEHEINQGQAGKGNPMLQLQIRDRQINVVKILQEMSQLMKDTYGILVTSPGQLLAYLESS